jgi:hypothetical protein
MRSISRVSLAALLVAAGCLASVAVAAAQTAAPATHPAPEAPKWAERRVDDRAAMLDARVAGLRAGLRLTPEQEKLWGPFEAAVRDFADARTARMQGMQGMNERDDKGEGPDMAGPAPSPIDRLDRTATRLSEVGAALRKIADAGKPLYASLDEQQKRMFGYLSHEMMRMGRGHHSAGMGMMMGPPAHPPHDGGDNDESDDEQ